MSVLPPACFIIMNANLVCKGCGSTVTDFDNGHYYEIRISVSQVKCSLLACFGVMRPTLVMALSDR